MIKVSAPSLLRPSTICLTQNLSVFFSWLPGREASTQFASGDAWTAVDPVEGALTINIGDMLMRWSDDRFKSNFHRVRMPLPSEYTVSLDWSL